MRGNVKSLVNIVVNYHFKFDCDYGNDKQNMCKKVNNDVITQLLDLCDKEWNLVGNGEQFMFLKRELF